MQPRRFQSLWRHLSGDPVELGLVESLARPGGNVTGLTTLSRELGGKRLEILKDIVPKLSRVAILYDATIPSGTIEVKEDLPAAVRGLGLTARYLGLRAVDDFERVFRCTREGTAGRALRDLGRTNESEPATDWGFCVEEPATVGVQQPRIYRHRWAHVLRGGPGG